MLLGTVAWFPSANHACFCLSEVPQAYEDAKVVFVGEVAEVVKPRTNDPKAPPADRLFTVKIQSGKVLKGAGFLDFTVPEIIVLSDQGRSGCFSWGSFLEGRRYLVYAEETNEKKLAVLSGCNRTVSLANASDDLKELERMSRLLFKFRSKRPFGVEEFEPSCP